MRRILSLADTDKTGGVFALENIFFKRSHFGFVFFMLKFL